MKKSAIVFLFSLSVASVAFAKSEGTTAVPFLKLGAGARGLGMGGAYSLLASGPDALFWNPAGLSSVDQVGVTLNHQSLMKVLSYDGGAISWPAKSSGLAVAYSQLKSDSIESLDSNGVSQGSFNTQDQLLKFGAGRRWHRWDVGLSGEYIRSSLADVEGSAFALAAGVNAPAYYGNKLQHGFIVEHVGGKIHYDQKDEDLPQQAKFATIYRPLPKLNLTADVTHGASGLDWALGGEKEIPLFENTSAAFVRAGYTTSNKDVASGLAFGAGLLYKKFQFDFAWVPQTEFGSSEVVTLTYLFGIREKRAVPTAQSAPPERKVKEYAAPAETAPTGGAPATGHVDFGGSSKRSRVYVVKEGDSLQKLADIYYGDKRLWTVIYSANRALIEDPTNLVVGQKILIPPGN